MGISVCIMVKDNESTIERCLKSISRWVDEIVILDTGSKDNTIPICKRYGGEINKVAFDGDFSKVRNRGLEIAKEEWILILDSDEEMFFSKGIKSILSENKETYGYYIDIVSLSEGKEDNRNSHVRLIRNFCGFKYRYPIHEDISKSIRESKGEEGLSKLDGKIVHYGYEGSLEEYKSKSLRNLEIIKRFVDEEESDYGYFLLGNVLGGLENFNLAKDAYERAIYLGILKGDYYISFMHSYVSFLVQWKCYERALEFISITLSYYSDFRDMYFFKALALNGVEDYLNAFEALVTFNNMKNISNYPTFYLEEKYKTKELEANIRRAVSNQSN